MASVSGIGMFLFSLRLRSCTDSASSLRGGGEYYMHRSCCPADSSVAEFSHPRQQCLPFLVFELELWCNGKYSLRICMTMNVTDIL